MDDWPDRRAGRLAHHYAWRDRLPDRMTLRTCARADGPPRSMSPILPARTRRAFRAAALTMAVLLEPGIGRADEPDHDAARRAVEAGEIRSLADILSDVRGKLPGEIVGMHIERKNSRWFYEFRVVDSQGRIFEVYVDAHSGAIERTKEK